MKCHPFLTKSYLVSQVESLVLFPSVPVQVSFQIHSSPIFYSLPEIELSSRSNNVGMSDFFSTMTSEEESTNDSFIWLYNTLRTTDNLIFHSLFIHSFVVIRIFHHLPPIHSSKHLPIFILFTIPFSLRTLILISLHVHLSTLFMLLFTNNI